MTYRGAMTRAVASALNSAEIAPRDAGAAALIRRYAALLDDAAPAAKYRKPLAELAAAVRRDGDEAAEALDAIRTALAEHSVASDLGPKLLAALTSLGLTLAGRGAKKEATGDKPVDPAKQAHDEIKAQRRKRADRAAALDTASS